MEINRGLAGTLGVSVGQIAQSLRPAFAGVDAGDWVDPSGETRYVRVRLAPEARASARPTWQRSRSCCPARAGGGPAVVPLGQVATHHARRRAGADRPPRPRDGHHRRRQHPGRSLRHVSRTCRRGWRRCGCPRATSISYGGQAADQAEVFGAIFTALGVAVMLMYLILVIQFGIFLDPLAILLSLPLSLIGVVLALLITGDTLNIMSLIGVILLMGIVAKNAILLIDFAKWTHERGSADARGAHRGGRDPPAADPDDDARADRRHDPGGARAGEGADFRAPLGRAVIGGASPPRC